MLLLRCDQALHEGVTESVMGEKWIHPHPCPKCGISGLGRKCPKKINFSIFSQNACQTESSNRWGDQNFSKMLELLGP